MGRNGTYNRFRYSVFVKNILHTLAMNAPANKLAIALYRMRGSKIASSAGIGHQVYMEETVPWLIEIGENVIIGPRTIITAQDGSYHRADPRQPKLYKKVIIEENAYIGAGVNIIRGVRIGKNSVIGAGSVVIHDIPANSVAVGNPARVIKTMDALLAPAS